MKRLKPPLIENMDFDVVIDMITYCFFGTTIIYSERMFWTTWILSYFWSTIMFIFLNDKNV
jgi:hypothetical protein